jgi:hypothetical protein
MNAARSLLVNRIAVAISSRHRRAFMQNSRFMYQCGTCSEEEGGRKRTWLGYEAFCQQWFYWIKRSLRYWVVQSSTLCIKLPRKVFLLVVQSVGWLNSARILSMVSRSNKTSASDIRFSSNVGSTGCVDLPVLQNVSQDALRFIVDVIFYRVTANHHH